MTKPYKHCTVKLKSFGNLLFSLVYLRFTVTKNYKMTFHIFIPKILQQIFYQKNATKFFSKWAVKLVCLECFYLYPDKLLLYLLIATRCDHIFCNLYLNHFP